MTRTCLRLLLLSAAFACGCASSPPAASSSPTPAPAPEPNRAAESAPSPTTSTSASAAPAPTAKSELDSVDKTGDVCSAAATPDAEAPAPANAKSKVRLGTPQVNGRIDPAEIARVAKDKTSRFDACFRAGARKNPKLAGRVVVHLVLDTTGKVFVSKVATESTVPDADAATCVARSFCDVAFPKPESGIATVAIPIDLK